jgi:hypothetical protein
MSAQIMITQIRQHIHSFGYRSNTPSLSSMYQPLRQSWQDQPLLDGQPGHQALFMSQHYLF